MRAILSLTALLQFSLVSGLLAPWGMVQDYLRWRIGCYGEVVAVLSSSLLLIGLLDFDYIHFRIVVFRPICWWLTLIMALWLGFAIDAGGKDEWQDDMSGDR